MITRQPTVVVFLTVDLHDNHGSAAWARNLLYQLRQIEGIRFVVVTSGPAVSRRENERTVLSDGFEHIHIPLRKESSDDAGGAKGIGAIRYAIQESYFYMFERYIRMQHHVDREFGLIVKNLQPALVMVNDIWAALAISTIFEAKQKTCLIMLNDEVSWHKKWLSQVVPESKYKRIRWLSQYRFRRRVNAIVGKCSALIVLTRSDIPKACSPSQRTAVLPPLLSEQREKWSHTSNRKLLFVGRIDYFANRRAVEWICTRLMPALRTLDGTISASIVGAVESCVPVQWRADNVTFLGAVEKEAVVRHLLSDGLFVAPIDNAFGAKLKLAECAAYGMPFVATEAAMSGLPFLPRVPRIVLNDPVGAAVIVKRCLDDGEMLNDLSAYVSQEMRRERYKQSLEWRDFIWKTIEERVVS